MPRIFRKGGTWKNHEDEVLKAAVMKYGKNRWARVASLLPKKTAANAKERWMSWLDPGIKKTDWTKEEEEKLLHLAKRLPCQWRTIAPIVGRTPHQCLEHYEKLVDQVQDKDDDYDPANDPRKLRPGEIDTHPEQKPPQPDALDMSEDEKEMLNEARARLANTRGKKAKRKARGKQLEEARRLASVQKRRELKAAGIDMGTKMRKKHGIDYANEIPFFKTVPKGFFDTSEELKRKPQDDKHFNNLDVQKAEGTTRAKEEFEARKQDKQKALKKKQDDLPGHFEALNKKVDAASQVKKSSLTMPAPQVTERELFALQKMSQGDLEKLQAERATVERTPVMVDTIRLEAENQAKMLAMPTPLVGGETPQLHNIETGPGLTPMHHVPSTPSLYATMGTREQEREKLAKLKAARGNVAAALENLSKPKDDVSLVLKISDEQMAVLQTDTEKEKKQLGEAAIDQTDAAEVKKRKKSGVIISTTTQAVRRGLPRPAVAPQLNKKPLTGQVSPDALITEELKRLVAYDSYVNPVKGKKSRNKVQLDDYSNDDLLKAAGEIAKEEAALKAASQYYTATDDNDGGNVAHGFRVADAIRQEMELAGSDFLFVPNPGRVLSKRQCSTADRLTALKHEFEIMRTHAAKAAEGASKLEKKVDLLTAGYIKRNQTLNAQLQAKWADLQDANIQLRSYEMMWQLEEVAIKERLRVAEERLQKQKEREGSLQAAYASANATLKGLHERANAKRTRDELAEADATALKELEMAEEGLPSKKPRVSS